MRKVLLLYWVPAYVQSPIIGLVVEQNIVIRRGLRGRVTGYQL